MSTARFWARKFGLDIAYDKAKIERPQLLSPGTKPSIPGTWNVYRGLGIGA